MKAPGPGSSVQSIQDWEELNAPRDYFIPNFGMDKDIIQTEENEKVASALVGHAWAFKTPESYEKYRLRSLDTEYNFDPALDEDMVDAQSSIGWAEQDLMRPIKMDQ